MSRRLRHILLGILIYGVATCWVRGRWAVGALEAAVFLCAGWAALDVALRRRPFAGGVLALPVAAMAVWAFLQVAAHWTVAPADTAGEILYWLMAASLVWLGYGTCASGAERLRFLKAALAAGFVISIAGFVQSFTSDGRVFWLFPSGYDSRVIGPFVSPNNYASFAVLLIPLALALSFTDKRNWKAYLLMAAALLASVVASGSRAGAALAVVESAAAFLLRPRAAGAAEGDRGRSRWLVFTCLATVFTFVAGWQYLRDKTTQARDSYLFRRAFFESSAAMVRAEPLHGFGLGAWPSAYGRFAVIDTGRIANHAHNEWIEWAAEGGWPALALMAVVFLASAPAAVRSIWGLGVIAVFLHSAVDYPFLRPGLAAWIFVLIGALGAYGRERRYLMRTAGESSRSRTVIRGSPPVYGRGPSLPCRLLAGLAIPALAFAGFVSAKLAWADVLYRRGTLDGIARASALCPDNAEYHFALAQMDREHAVTHLQSALAANPYLTKARIELAGEMEDRRNLPQAEAILLEAARRDRQYAAPWAVANFYFRNDRPDRFWPWARNAAAISYGDLHPLFDLCFLLTDDAQTVLDRVVVPRRAVESQFLDYLIEHRNLSAAGATARRFVVSAAVEDRDTLLHYVDQALAAGQIRPAREIWTGMCRRRLLPYRAAAEETLVNGDFSLPVLNHGFDWRLTGVDGTSTAQQEEDGPAIRVSFSGKQPENCSLLSQVVPLRSGAGYTLRFQYRTADLPQDTGLLLSLGTGQGFPLNGSGERPGAEWTSAEWRFRARGDAGRVSLEYHRLPGTTRIEGAIALRRVELSGP
jgi:O-antigen ligase